LRERVGKSPYAGAKDPPQLQLRHDMMRAKLAGYLDRPQSVFNSYPANDNSLPARYARAIARNCSGKCTDALGEVDALIRDKPDNPYFWELKSQLHFWIGKHRESIPPMRKALQLAGGEEPLMEIALAQSLLATEDAAVVDEAITLLRRAITRDDQNSMPYHQLAKALAKKGQIPQADLAAAQAHFVEGNVKQAQIFAKRAISQLPRGSPEWIRAEDIINYKQQT
jgi:predicted Zn-dependent protease